MKKNFRILMKFKIYHHNPNQKKANNNHKNKIKMEKLILNLMILWLEENIF
jgi:hypothetical protein